MKIVNNIIIDQFLRWNYMANFDSYGSEFRMISKNKVLFVENNLILIYIECWEQIYFGSFETQTLGKLYQCCMLY